MKSEIMMLVVLRDYERVMILLVAMVKLMQRWW